MGGERNLKLRCGASRAFDDANVAFRAGVECAKRSLVSLAFVSGNSDVIALKFDKNRALLRAGCNTAFVEGVMVRMRQRVERRAQYSLRTNGLSSVISV